MKLRSLIWGVALIGVFLLGCEEESTNQSSDKTKVKKEDKVIVKSHASSKEYQKSSPLVQKMANQVDAAVASLKTMEMYSNDKKSDYYAIVAVSKEEKGSVLANTIIISSDGGKLKDVQGSCTACNAAEGWSCYRQIKSYMKENNMDEIDLHVEVDDGCATVTY